MYFWFSRNNYFALGENTNATVTLTLPLIHTTNRNPLWGVIQSISALINDPVETELKDNGMPNENDTQFVFEPGSSTW